MNTKKLIGTILGVIMFAALIAGATFAYFSASAASNNAINVGSSTVTLRIKNESNNFYSDLIPVDSTNANFKAYPGLVKKTSTLKGRGTNTCSDEVGNSICGVYQFTIENPSTNTSSQTVYGSMTVKSNGFPVMTSAASSGVTAVGKSNLYYAVFKGAASSHYGNFDLNGTVGKVTATNTKMVQGKTALGQANSFEDWKNNTEQLLAPGESQTYTILVWLEENGAFNSGDQTKTFTASIEFNTGTGKGVTAQLTNAT